MSIELIKAVSTDLEGPPRPQGQGYDRGLSNLKEGKRAMSYAINRRRFMQTTAGSGLGLWLGGELWAQGGAPKDASGSVTVPDSAGVARKFWIDPSIAAWAPGPWRKVHIEYHTSRHIPRLGERFNADEFGDQLLAAHVNGATVFAKDMYGYSYFPTRYGRMHPNLSFDLLGAQVAVLKKRNIQVLAYFMLTWNPELAERHPEWLVVPTPGGVPPPPEEKGYQPYLWKFCLCQEGFVQGELDHLRELVSRYELDGVWLDGGSSPPCYCPACVQQLRERGLDPFDASVQAHHKLDLCYSFLQRIYQTIKETRPGCLVCPQNQGSFYGLGRRVSFTDYSSQEALFTDAAHYGYYYFPTVIRYARGFGIPIHGLTTRFKDFWADFGGLKLPSQLHLEVAATVAHGARCDIGDQMPPSGRLDPAVYHVIGQAYTHIEKLEPYLEQAVPVTEAAILAHGSPFGSPCTEINYGWVKLLTESRVQFDIVECEAKWEERYALILLPEDFAVGEATADRLHSFIAGGGAVIATHHSGLLAGTEKSWMERYGLYYAGLSPFTPAYLVPQVNFTGDIPPYEYALYEGASQWRAEAPATVLALLGEPLFQRSPEHYTSHSQTPFDHTTSYAVLAWSSPPAVAGLGPPGRVGLVAFPLGQGYYNQGYWIYRQAFQKLLGELLRPPLLQTDAPLSTEVTLTHQAARPRPKRKERYLVHIVNFSPARRTPKHTEYYEDPIPLTNVRVRVNLPLNVSTARALYAGKNLPVRRAAGGGVEFLVPRVDIHEVVCLEL